MQLPSPEELKQKRIDLGLTQSDLAKRAGVSQPLIARIEAGDVDPRLSTLRKIIDVFNDIEKEDIFLKDIMNRDLISVDPDDSIDKAASIMEKYNISQIPVIQNGISVGSISENMIVRSMSNKKASEVSHMKIGDIMGDSFPTLSPGTDIKTASYMLEKHPAVLVLEKGHVAGVVTKHDILKLLSE
ncbi:CBS domain-containing protein [Methanolobus vulcani]|jgi:predicted transcriptional regulator|uniref:CBS domain-containing protein n=1 Tax=Methanolobus vulcani TaxID=38026 RepID=A0A7Z8KLF5_9EURY|nr:CBS domain-containing protein [Methanolobus vulcani]TQD23430.1 CBS domain-containing protein [Methanolobus vulcani]